MPLFADEEKKKRKMVGKTEWSAIKAIHKNKCIICGRTEKQVGVLEKAHVKAHSRGGTHIVPMCPTCHKKYDKGLLNKTECRKLGIDPDKYQKLIPKKSTKKKKDSFWF